MPLDKNITRDAVHKLDATEVGYGATTPANWPVEPHDVEDALDKVTGTGGIDHGATGGLTDDDHTQYSRVDGTRAFTGTVGGITPVANTDLTPKEYVDTAVGFEFDYYLTDTASDIGGYFVIQNEVGGAESSHTLAAAGTGDDQLIVSFATPSGEPGVTALSSGVYDGKFQADRTVGTKSVNLYWTLSKRILAGGETLLMTSELSAAITGRVSVDLHAVLAAEVEILVTDRLVFKIYANVGATGSAATIVIYQEGTNDSHITVGVESSVLNNIFVRQDVATTKGDVLAATAASTITRLGVGSNDQVLIADSGEATGLKWGALPAKWRTKSLVLYIENPLAADAYLLGYIPSQVTLIEAHGVTDVGTCTINIEFRAKTTPDAAGTDMLTADLALDPGGEATTTFVNHGSGAGVIATDQWFTVTVTSVATAPTQVWLNLEFTID